MKNSLYAALAATILALGACGGSGGEAAEPAPAAPIADDNAADNAAGTEAEAPAEETAPAEPAAPASTAGLTEADLDAAWGIMQAMVKAAADHKDDCKAMAGAFSKVFDDNADLMKKMNTMKDDDAMKAKWDEKYKAESEKLMMSMMGDMGSCMQDPDMQAAMKKMQ